MNIVSSHLLTPEGSNLTLVRKFDTYGHTQVSGVRGRSRAHGGEEMQCLGQCHTLLPPSGPPGRLVETGGS
eukprot:5358450-Prymnesium_polylepis.4